MKRRIAAVIAALALTISSLSAGAPAAGAEPLAGASYVALGDSIAAGTGNLPYANEECLRSRKSYPMLLARTLGVPVASSACSGATTADVINEQLGDLGPATRLVTLTVGINNLPWQQLLLACSTPEQVVACQALQAQAFAAAQALPGNIAGVLAAIRARAPQATIVVTGYPMLFGAVTDSCSIGAYRGTPVKVSAGLAGQLNAGVTGVNSAIGAGVFAYANGTGDFNVAYVPVAGGFAGHGLCDTQDRWISGFVSGKPNLERSLHPNSPGQKAYARILAGAVGS